MAEEQVLFADREHKSDHDALELAWKDIRERDPQAVARGAPATYDAGRRAFTVAVLDRKATALLDEKRVVWESGEPVGPPFHLLILHYLSRCREVEPSGELIGFRELEGGNLYYQAFEAKSIRTVTAAFGHSPGKLLEAGKALGAEPFRLGQASIRVPLFPRLPVIVVIWAGDDEVPAASNFLFDSTVRDLLHTEDVAVLCSLLASMLRKAS
jgi:hypothetical protein